MYTHIHTAEIHFIKGDELRLRYVGKSHLAWDGIGHVTKVPNSK